MAANHPAGNIADVRIVVNTKFELSDYGKGYSVASLLWSPSTQQASKLFPKRIPQSNRSIEDQLALLRVKAIGTEITFAFELESRFWACTT
jgi:hypothetical protein